MKDIRAASFDTVADLYGEARPGYPADVYKEMEKYIQFSRRTKILEIGAGDGKATWDLYQRWLPLVTALEPGPALFKLLQKRFAGTSGVTLARTSFEKFVANEIYDVVLSATAFHWVRKEARYVNTAQLLRNKGHLVLFWNNYSRSNNPVFDEIQKIYRHHYPGYVNVRDIRERQRVKIEERRSELEDSSYFKLIRHWEYLHIVSLSAKEYINLIKTFSDNSTKEKERLNPFYEAIEKLIMENGNRLDLPIHVNLEIGEKMVSPIRRKTHAMRHM